ncbi:hypothetical protein [Thermotoga profunda]|uniref:hypothetical protein n=1 Tax=Thermotoga profunda TaxID=1508420 RepID=UPI001186A0EF|nr:hypothetical protein [Thermotoga profunda]
MDANEEAKRIIGEVFNFFMKNPDKLPKETRERRKLIGNISKEKKALVIADYISGMTDDWLFINYETYLYSHFSRFKELQFKKSCDWIKPLEEAEQKGQIIKIDKPEDLALYEGTKMLILTLEGIKERNLKIKGKAIYRKYDHVEIEELDDVISGNDVLVVEDDIKTED